MKIRFQDPVMQHHYENLIIKDKLHWKEANRKTIETFEGYDKVSYR